MENGNELISWSPQQKEKRFAIFLKKKIWGGWGGDLEQLNWICICTSLITGTTKVKVNENFYGGVQPSLRFGYVFTSDTPIILLSQLNLVWNICQLNRPNFIESLQTCHLTFLGQSIKTRIQDQTTNANDR